LTADDFEAAAMANVLHLDESLNAPTLAAQTTDLGGWRRELPILTGQTVTLRGLREADAPALLDLLEADEIRRFVSAPPASLGEFRSFIGWTRRQQEAGTCASFAVTRIASDAVVGLIQVRDLGCEFEAAEWGFAIAANLWGTGVFHRAAQLALQFVFETLNTHRLEARALARNGRGIAALRKLGAVEEGVLRQSFRIADGYADQVLCSILRDDWFARRQVARQAA
jgi:RimJ/RimL family protein N-acetyltransferase